VRVTNEVDHEWNNRFLGPPQTIEYLSTGAARGVVEGRKAPMAAPGAPVSLGISYDVADDVSWTCAVTNDEQTRTLDARACSTLLRGGPEGADSTWSTLFIHIADEGIRFGLTAEVADGTLDMESATLTPTTQLPLFALLSQHLYPGRNDWTCEGRADVRQRVPFEVDWFLYAEDPALSREAAFRAVRAVRQRGIARLATVAGARLERPDRPVVGWADRWGYGARTTPLEITLTAPREMAPGETATLLALPPERNGTFRYTWTLTAVSTRGRTSTETRSDAFELRYTFPRRTERVTVRVRVEELDDAREVVRNATVQPVERELTIYRRP
jgi:hypothetical protein